MNIGGVRYALTSDLSSTSSPTATRRVAGAELGERRRELGALITAFGITPNTIFGHV